MKNKTKQSTLLFVVSALVLIFIGFQVGKNQRSNQEKTVTTTQATQSAIDSTSDWLVYSNLQEEYSLKYPNTWVIIENGKTSVCPKDYETNLEKAKECFSLASDSRSLSEFISDLEKESGNTITISPSMIRYSNGNVIYHFFNEGSRELKGYSYSYITHPTLGKSIVVASATAWNDYGYHLEPQILDTLQFTK